MDIVTHTGIGIVAAAPFVGSNPELALGLIAGSVLPDLDAISRIFGKRAFLRSHQTWSHAVPIQAAVGLVVGLITRACEANGWGLGLGLFAGLAVHSLLDFSNTLGVTLFAPLTRKRLCLEWVFFIDAFVLALTGVTTGWMLWSIVREGVGSQRLVIGFFGVIALYFCVKGWLRTRAGALAPDAMSLVPSSLCPWHFFGTTRNNICIHLFCLNAITGGRRTVADHEVLDSSYADVLATIPEYLLMRELSPAYHAVAASETEAGELVVCRDLRTRNFGTTFGDLEVWLDARRKVSRINFHV